MQVKFDPLSEATRIHGVWRNPGEIVELPKLQAQDCICQRFARPAADPAALTRHRFERPAQEADWAGVAQVAKGQHRFHCWRDVAIVIPCFNSTKHLPRCIESVGHANAQQPRAICAVIDGDALAYDLNEVSSVTLSRNTGFAHACNVGAKHTESKYICFLNADTEVKAGWLDGLIHEMESAPDIAVVGGRQLDGRGKIHSCGSEWSWLTHHYEHDLRGGTPGNQPQWNQARDLDAITGSCILVRRDVFEELGGFDKRYRIGYWEDSDFCMRIRQAGYRIRFTPESEIIHYQGHSDRGFHSHYRENAQLCRRRWAETGLVDRFARQRGRCVQAGDVVACYIVLNEEEYIAASLESIYPLADRIVIVEGGNEYAVAAGLCGPDKRSMDGTLDEIESFPDAEGKIEVVTGMWRDKAEQRNAYADRLNPGDWMLLMDGDEVFYEAGLWRLSALMHERKIIRPMFDLFWNDFETLGTGIWDAFPQVKAVRWKQGYRYRDHNCPCDARGRLIAGANDGLLPERLYAHYAWVKPIEKLRRKAAYYERQPGARERIRPNYIDTVFLPWRQVPDGIEREFGTHPFGGGGTARFSGRHPGPIAKRLKEGRFTWK